MSAHDAIAGAVRKLVQQQFADQSGRRLPLYDLIVGAAEKPLLEAVLAHHHGNQVHAALALGINRNTLRKKMQLHGIGARP